MKIVHFSVQSGDKNKKKNEFSQKSGMFNF